MCAKVKPILNEHIISLTGQSEPVSIFIRNLGPSAWDSFAGRINDNSDDGASVDRETAIVD
jgi:hypothetical protein